MAAIRLLIPAERMETRIEELAGRLHSVAPVGPITFLVIERGGRRFAEALARALKRFGRTIELIGLRVRRSHGMQLGEVVLEDEGLPLLRSRWLVVVDDVVDEGRTLHAVLERVARDGPAAVRTAVLVSKLERRRVDVKLDDVAFEVEAGWVVGYGMDLDGRYRELDYLAVVDP